MTEREKMIAGDWYDVSDPWLVAQRDLARNTAEEYNLTKATETSRRRQILESILGAIGEDVEIYPSVKFDYGCNIYLGDRVYINFNAVFLDCAEIRIGNDVFIGPNVSFLTPIHPLLPRDRNQRVKEDGTLYMLEAASPITIGNDVWIGGDVTFLPGVKVGDGTVIGAGSVVTKDIPSGVLAVGNPCRVVRELTEEDGIGM